MFGKKKVKLFGNEIEPNCAYCANFSDGICRVNLKGPPCGSFRYDPLKRTPEHSPALKDYNPDDFKL